MLAVGTDLIAIARIAESIDRFGDRFLNRVYTERELSDSAGRVESLAARFAAKEAAAKALGCGIGDIGWRDVEVIRDDKKKPHLCLHGPAADLAATLGMSESAVSMSHEQGLAMATVVLT